MVETVEIFPLVFFFFKGDNGIKMHDIYWTSREFIIRDFFYAIMYSRCRINTERIKCKTLVKNAYENEKRTYSSNTVL